MRWLRITSMSICILALVVGVMGYVRQHKGKYPARSYVMVSTETFYPKSGEPSLRAIRSRWVTAGGEWKEVLTPSGDGKSINSKVTFSSSAGQFLHDERTNSLYLLNKSAPAMADFRSIQFLQSHPEYVRQESMLGLDTFVFKADTASGVSVERHFAPVVGDIPIKVVMHQSNGDVVIEAIKIDFTEVTNDMLAKPNLDVKLDVLNQRIENAEKYGYKNYADSLRTVVRDWQEKNGPKQ